VSASFVAQLRTGRAPITLAEPGAPGAITLRVEAADLWETVRVIARPDTPLAELKSRVVSEIFADQRHVDEFILKLHGWEMLDERSTLAESGVVDGSIVLLSFRRRRPVR
jgi:hypothetical protein